MKRKIIEMKTGKTVSPKTGMITVLISILLASLICLNGVRCILNISESNMIINMIYILFIVLCLPRFFQNNSENRLLKKIGLPYICVSLFLGLMCVITGIADSQYTSMLKLIVIIAMGFCIIQLDESEINLSLNIAAVISTIYVIYVILKINDVNRYISRGSNYLNVTLPIGLMLSVFLTRVLLCIANRKKISALIYFLLSSIHLYSLFLFSARGSILIPIVTVLLLAMLIGKKNIKTFITVIIVLCIVGIIGYYFFTKYANSYLTTRMSNLFVASKSEDRWQIWDSYIELIKSKHLWIVGGGTNYSQRYFGIYPHNFYLQMIGEFGFIGIAYSMVSTFIVVKSVFFKYRFLRDNACETENSAFIYYQILAALLYVFLTFMKSFSIYDSALLIIFFSLSLSMCPKKS